MPDVECFLGLFGQLEDKRPVLYLQIIQIIQMEHTYRLYRQNILTDYTDGTYLQIIQILTDYTDRTYLQFKQIEHTYRLYR